MHEFTTSASLLDESTVTEEDDDTLESLGKDGDGPINTRGEEEAPYAEDDGDDPTNASGDEPDNDSNGEEDDCEEDDCEEDDCEEDDEDEPTPAEDSEDETPLDSASAPKPIVLTDEADAEAAIRALDAEDTSDSLMEAVAASDSAPEPDSPEVAQVREQKQQMAIQALINKGFSAEQAAIALATTAVHGLRQRRFPSFAPATHSFTRAFFAGRSDEQIQADAAKHCRNDGGAAGPVATYVKFIVAAGADPDAADVAATQIADHVQRRIRAIRAYVIASANELTVRRIERSGGDLTRGAYLKAR